MSRGPLPGEPGYADPEAWRCECATRFGRCERAAIKFDGELRTCGRTHEGPAVSTKVDRNAPCACGCGRKAKRCANR
jgi:hypothetical protein